MKEPNIIPIALDLLVSQDEGEPLAFHRETRTALALALEVFGEFGELDSCVRELIKLAYVLEVDEQSPSAAALILDVLSANDEAAQRLRGVGHKGDRERLVEAGRRFSRFSGERGPVAPSNDVGRPYDDLALRALVRRRRI